MSPLPNLPRALLVRRMRAAAPELYTALVDAITHLLHDSLQVRPVLGQHECLRISGDLVKQGADFHTL